MMSKLMDNNSKKDLVEGATAVGLVLAGAPAVAAAAVPILAGDAFRRFHDRRVRRWFERVCSAEDGAAIASLIEKGLLNDDASVIEGVFEGARAAASAIDLAALPVIAELSRRYFSQADLPRWFYRGGLELLQRLDASEVGALARLFAEVRPIRSESITLYADFGKRGWRATQSSVSDPWVPISQFAEAARLFAYIRQSGLGLESGGYGVAGSPNVLVVERRVSDWLHAAFAAVRE